MSQFVDREDGKSSQGQIRVIKEIKYEIHRIQN